MRDIFRFSLHHSFFFLTREGVSVIFFHAAKNVCNAVCCKSVLRKEDLPWNIDVEQVINKQGISV